MLWNKTSRSALLEGPELPSSPSRAPADLENAAVQPELPQPEATANDPQPVKTPTPARQPQVSLGGSVVFKGELSGREDLLIEGQCEGTVNLEGYCLTIGSEGQVKSDIHARQVVVHGTVNGKISATERVEIRRTGTVVGDIASPGVAIEDGAYFKGNIEILRQAKQGSARAAVV